MYVSLTNYTYNIPSSFFFSKKKKTINLNKRTVHRHRTIHFLPLRFPNPLLPNHPKIPQPHLPLHLTPPGNHPNAPPLPHPAFHPRLPSHLRLPHRPVLPPQFPPPHPQRIYRRHDRRAAAVVELANVGMRDLRTGLDLVDVSSFDSERNARESDEEGLARGVGVESCGVVVWGLSSICAWVCDE